VRQPVHGLRAGLDAIFLAAAVPAAGPSAPTVLDAGAGCGIVGLAIARRCAGALVTAVEIEPVLARLARHNARANDLASRVSVVEADLTRPVSEIAELEPRVGHFDHVVANPPYFDTSRVRVPREETRARAMTLETGGLERWLRFLAAMAGPDGRLTMIHRACDLEAVLAAADGRFGALTVFPLFPRAGAPAHRIIVTGVRGSRAPLRLLAGMALHDASGRFLPEASRILREGAPLPLATDREPDTSRLPSS